MMKSENEGISFDFFVSIKVINHCLTAEDNHKMKNVCLPSSGDSRPGPGDTRIWAKTTDTDQRLIDTGIL